MTTQMILDLDDDNEASVQEAIATYQRRKHRIGVRGEQMVGEGEGDMAGRILAEICRDWLEYHA